MKKFLLLLISLLVSFTSFSLEYDQDGIKFSYGISPYDNTKYSIWNVIISAEGHVDLPQTINGKKIRNISKGPIYILNATSLNFGDVAVNISWTTSHSYKVEAPFLQRITSNSGWIILNDIVAPNLEFVSNNSSNGFEITISAPLKKRLVVNTPNAKSLYLKGEFDYIEIYECNSNAEIIIGDSGIKSYCDSKNLSNIKFLRCPNLAEIDMPNMSNIPDDFASGCTNLQKVNINNALTIGANSFKDCSSLKSIDFPKAEKVGTSAFSGCSSLESINLPNVTTLGGSAFGNCTNLTKLNIPNLQSIGGGAFNNCASLSEVVMPSVQELGGEAFRNCSSLKRAILPNINNIKAGTFLECKSLQNLYFPNVTEIAENAFEKCEALTSIEFPEVTTIGNKAFLLCKNLTNINLPKAMIIGYDAFNVIGKFNIYFPQIEIIRGRAFSTSQPIDIDYIEFPASLQSIETLAFNNIHFSRIKIDAINPPELGMYGENISPLWSFDSYLEVPDKSLEAYRSHRVWKRFKYVDGLLHGYLYSGAFEKFESVETAKPVRGCTADGLSQIIFPIDDLNKWNGEVAQLKVGDKEITDNRYGSCRLEYLDGTKAIVYTAPKDYPSEQSGYFCNVTLEVKIGSDTHTGLIELWKPAVLLVHGLGSDKSGLQGIYNHLGSDYLSSYQLVQVDYKGSNTQSFHDNTYRNCVLDKYVRVTYENLLNGKGIVSSKYDLVGHSMGGILSRMYAGSSTENFNRVNRIITINTPHGGSQLANLGFDILQKIEWDANFLNPTNPVKDILDPLITLGSKYLNIGAVKDLMVGSTAINHLNRDNNKCVGIPAHTIGSYMNPDDENESLTGSSLDSFEKMGVWYLISQYPFVPRNRADWNRLYNGPHDGVVALDSQSATPGDATTIESAFYPTDLFAFGMSSPAHHTNVCSWDETCENVGKLLKSSVESNCFTKDGFSNLNLSYDCDVSTFISSKVEQGASAPQLSPLVSETDESNTDPFIINIDVADDGSVLNIDVKPRSDIYYYCTNVYADGEFIYVKHNTEKNIVTIPQDISSTAEIAVYGYDSANNLVATTKAVELNNTSTLHDIYLDNSQLHLSAPVGSLISPIMYGVWDNSVTRITPQYSSSAKGIAVVGSDILCLSPGKYKVTASAKDIEKELDIEVFGTSDGFTPIESLTLNSQSLEMRPGEEYQLSTVAVPEHHTEAFLEWTSSHPNIATVDEVGNVTAQSPGTAVITCNSLARKADSCYVNVIDDNSTALINPKLEKIYSVWDLFGRLLIKDAKELNLSKLQHGIYIICDGTQTYKILKQ